MAEKVAIFLFAGPEMPCRMLRAIVAPGERPVNKATGPVVCGHRFGGPVPAFHT